MTTWLRKVVSARQWSLFALAAVLSLILGGISTKYVVEFWLGYVGQPVVLPWLPALLVGVFTAQVMVPFAVVTWFLAFFI